MRTAWSTPAVVSSRRTSMQYGQRSVAKITSGDWRICSSVAASAGWQTATGTGCGGCAAAAASPAGATALMRWHARARPGEAGLGGATSGCHAVTTAGTSNSSMATTPVRSRVLS
eukprot:4931761-Prymnesium_polylepis.2